MERVIGAVVIVMGAVVIGYNPKGRDVVLVDLPWRGHGIHLSDVVGMTLVLFGITLLWRAPRQPPG